MSDDHIYRISSTKWLYKLKLESTQYRWESLSPSRQSDLSVQFDKYEMIWAQLSLSRSRWVVQIRFRRFCWAQLYSDDPHLYSNRLQIGIQLRHDRVHLSFIGYFTPSPFNPLPARFRKNIDSSFFRLVGFTPIWQLIITNIYNDKIRHRYYSSEWDIPELARFLRL